MNFLLVAHDIKILDTIIPSIYLSTLGDVVIEVKENPLTGIIAMSHLDYDDLDNISATYSLTDTGTASTIMDRMVSLGYLPSKAYNSLRTVINGNLRNKHIYAISAKRDFTDEL